MSILYLLFIFFFLLMKFDLWGLHRGYDVVCPAWEWTTLVKVSMRNYAETYSFTLVDGWVVDWVVRLTTGYVFSTTKEVPLRFPMVFKKSSFDTRYTIAINPEKDCVLRTPDREWSAKNLSYMLSFLFYMICFGVLMIVRVVFFP
jgi:hypothetical protein